jgi:hypothetical protein
MVLYIDKIQKKNNNNSFLTFSWNAKQQLKQIQQNSFDEKFNLKIFNNAKMPSIIIGTRK